MQSEAGFHNYANSCRDRNDGDSSRSLLKEVPLSVRYTFALVYGVCAETSGCTMGMFSYVTVEQRVPQGHLLLRTRADGLGFGLFERGV